MKWVLFVCSAFTMLTVVFVADRLDDLQALMENRTRIAQWHALNDACRDGRAVESTCERRDAATKRLNDDGWCYGSANEAMYLKQWHRC